MTGKERASAQPRATAIAASVALKGSTHGYARSSTLGAAGPVLGGAEDWRRLRLHQEMRHHTAHCYHKAFGFPGWRVLC